MVRAHPGALGIFTIHIVNHTNHLISRTNFKPFTRPHLLPSTTRQFHTDSNTRFSNTNHSLHYTASSSPNRSPTHTHTHTHTRIHSLSSRPLQHSLNDRPTDTTPPTPVSVIGIPEVNLNNTNRLPHAVHSLLKHTSCNQSIVSHLAKTPTRSHLITVNPSFINQNVHVVGVNQCACQQ